MVVTLQSACGAAAEGEHRRQPGEAGSAAAACAGRVRRVDIEPLVQVAA
jgi:hypothetical protein